MSEDGIDLKILGFESDEEIVKIEIPLKDIDKVEASFEERTVLFLFVTEDICEAALQSLAMTNIASFSFVDKAIIYSKNRNLSQICSLFFSRNQ